jgi:hypothetical protein
MKKKELRNKNERKCIPGIQNYDFHRVVGENVVLVALYEFQMEVYNVDFEN